MNTQYRKNLKAVAQACKNYTDKEIKKVYYNIGHNDITTDDHTDEATYRFTAPANSKLLMLQSVAGNSVKYSPSVASDSTSAYQKSVPSYSPSIDRASASMNILGGMSYKVNQLVRNGDFSNGTTYWRPYSSNQASLSVSSNVMTLTTLNDISSSLYTGALAQDFVSPLIVDHKYLIRYEAYSDYYDTIGFDNVYNYANVSITLNQWNIKTAIFTQQNFVNLNGVLFIPKLTNVGQTASKTIKFRNIQIFDLTDMGIDTTDVSIATTELLKRNIDINVYNSSDTGSMRDTAITNVKSVGINMWDESVLASISGFTKTDGCWVATGGNWLNMHFDTYVDFLPDTQYTFTFSAKIDSGISNTRLTINYTDGTVESLSYGTTTFADYSRTTSANKTVSSVYFNYGSGGNTNVYIKDFMIVKGSTAPTTYKPYFSDTLAINNNIQALDGYGMGRSGAYNYIDFNAKKFNANTYTQVFTGQENGWIVYDSKPNSFALECSRFPNKKPKNNILYNNTTETFGWTKLIVGEIGTKNGVYVEYTNTIIVTVTSCSTLAEFQTYLQSHLLALNYDISPVETDISEYLDGNEIEIEPNGTLSFESTYSAYVPSNVSYNGVIKHALATAVKYESFNLWDEECKNGTSLDTDTGQEVISAGTVGYSISKNPISILPNTSYYATSLNNKQVVFYYYDVNNNYLGFVVATNSSKTTPNNARWLKIRISENPYDNDICINISGTLNGTYKPHKPTYTRALTNNEAKYSWGITTGVRNVRTYCDDEGNAVNEGSSNVDNKDIGTLDWGIYNNRFYTRITDIARVLSAGILTNILCSKYETGQSGGSTAYSTKHIWQEPNENVVYCYDDNFANATTFKTAMNGVPLFYEKNTTDTETLDDFDYFFDCEEGDTFTLVNTEQLQCYATYSFLIKEAKSNE